MVNYEEIADGIRCFGEPSAAIAVVGVLPYYGASSIKSDFLKESVGEKILRCRIELCDAYILND